MRGRLLPIAAVLLLAGLAVWFLANPSRLTEDPVVVDPPRENPALAPPDAHLAGRPPAESPDSLPAASAPTVESAEWKPVVVRAVRYGTGERLAGILVVATDATGRRHEGRTDAQGEFVFRDLAPGRARLVAVAPGWVSETIEHVDVTAAGGLEFFSLLRSVAARGRILSAIDDMPIARARVIAAASGTVGYEETQRKGDVWAVEETGPDGGFLLEAVPLQEDITLTVLAPGFARHVRRVVFHDPHAAEPDIVVRLRPGGGVRGTVRDRSGSAVPGARVYVFPDGDEWLRAAPRGSWTDDVRSMASLRGIADADGRFQVRGLALDARYAATAFAKGHVRAKDVDGLVLTTDTDELTITLVLHAPARAELRALDDEGRPVVAALASVVPIVEGFSASEVRAKSNAEGQVVLPGLGPGRHRLKVTCDGFLPIHREIDVAEGETVRMDVRLDRGVAISGILVDDQGQPLRGARVTVSREGADQTPLIRAKADEKGRFSVEGLEEGVHQLVGDADYHARGKSVDVVAPAADVRLVLSRLSVVRGRLVLPPGAPRPERILVGSYHSSGGGGSHQPWPDEPLTWYVPSEPRVLRVQGEGFAPWEIEVRMEPGTTRELGDIPLSVGVDLAGVVVGPGERPIEGATIQARNVAFRTTQTDAEGRFALRHLPVGEQDLEVRVSGYIHRRLETNRLTSDSDLRIVLARGGVLRVRVVDAEGVPVVGRWVQARPSDMTEEDDPDAYWDRVYCDEANEQGRVELRVIPGAYHIEVEEGKRGEDEYAVVGKASVAEGETVEKEVRHSGVR